MGVNGAPTSFSDRIVFRNHYEREYQVFSKPQQELLAACMGEMLKLSLPALFRPIVRQILPWMIPHP